VDSGEKYKTPRYITLTTPHLPLCFQYLPPHHYSPLSSSLQLSSPLFISLHLFSPLSTSLHLSPPLSTSLHLSPPLSISLHLSSPLFTSLHLTPPYSTFLHLSPPFHFPAPFHLLHEAFITHTSTQTAKIIRPLLESVAYLHDLGIVHRDLKPENILCGEELEDLKIADFGLSKMVLPQEKMDIACGTLSYVAPEVLTMQVRSNTCWL
jgi:hypothetical protein